MWLPDAHTVRKMASPFLLSWILCLCLVPLWSVGDCLYNDKVGNTNPMDRRVLDFLYNVTYDTYHEHANWTGWNTNSSSDPCVDEWYGITCVYIEEESVYYVSGIDLPNHLLPIRLPGRTDRNETPEVADIKRKLFSVKSSLGNICNAVAGAPGH